MKAPEGFVATGQLGRAWGAYLNWWFSPLPRARVARLRAAVYFFVFLDVFVLRPWVGDNGSVSPDLYHPLMIGRWLLAPVPTPLVVTIVKYSLLLSAGLALTGRWPRLAGSAVFLLYMEWMLIAFSYGKVDHDRFAFLVALAVLPWVGRASWNDERTDEISGWAIRCVQVAVVATYFLASIAKIRYGGIDWVNGATLTRAILRRGTFLTDPIQDNRALLQMAQYGIVLFELCSPLMLLRSIVGRVYVAVAFVFHLLIFATITIMFWPHVVCLLSFLPLEKLRRSPARLEGSLRVAG